MLLTALTAILGMIPLARSVFWGPMAITIMGGLFVATVLTLVVVPALYAMWFRVRKDEPADASARPPKLADRRGLGPRPVAIAAESGPLELRPRKPWSEQGGNDIIGAGAAGASRVPAMRPAKFQLELRVSGVCR